LGYVEKDGETRLIKSVDHVKIEVRDLTAASKSWSSLLGKVPDQIFTDSLAGRKGMRFSLQRGAIELIEGEQNVLKALAFICADLRSALLEFHERGLKTGPLKTSELVSARGESCIQTSCEVYSSHRRGKFITLVERSKPSWAFLKNFSKVLWLDHVVVKTSEPELAKAFYGHGLGLRLPLDETFPQWKARMMFFRTGGVTVEVVSSLGDSGQVVDTFWGLAFRVTGISEEHDRLKKVGFIGSDLRNGRKTGTRVFDLKNAPAGIPTLVISREQLDG
tara:strand:- start:440 stop:1270 length:831 start_codon:yes stop_codon:yes gene_type:complete